VQTCALPIFFLRLVALRYRLQWAHVRRSIARTVGYVAFQIVVAVIALWALAAGISAFATAAEYDVVRPVVRFVLFAVFVSTIGGSVLLGFGMHQTFSDRALRAYPISALQRFWMRHCKIGRASCRERAYSSAVAGS